MGSNTQDRRKDPRLAQRTDLEQETSFCFSLSLLLCLCENTTATDTTLPSPPAPPRWLSRDLMRELPGCRTAGSVNVWETGLTSREIKGRYWLQIVWLKQTNKKNRSSFCYMFVCFSFPTRWAVSLCISRPSVLPTVSICLSVRQRHSTPRLITSQEWKENKTIPNVLQTFTLRGTFGLTVFSILFKSVLGVWPWKKCRTQSSLTL